MKRRRFLAAIRDGLLLSQAPRATLGSRALNPGGASEADKVVLKLFLAGDVMLGRGIDQVLPHPSPPTLFEDFVRDAGRYVELAEASSGRLPESIDYRYVWGRALDVLERARPDLRIVNLETSVTISDDYWVAKGIHYRMHPRNAPCLTAAGIDCCVVANNHVMDWGYSGLHETLQTLQDVDIGTAGAGADHDQAARPARLSVNGKPDVLVFGVADTSSGVPGSWRATRDKAGVFLLDDLSTESAEALAARILAYRRPEDIVTVSIH